MVVDDKDYCYLYHLPPLLVVAVVRVIVAVVVAAVRGVVVIV